MNAGLTYPIESFGATGTLVDVAPGIRGVRMPLPFALDHVNAWLLDDDDGGITIVDTGAGTNDTMAAWDTLFARLPSTARVSRVIATHMHPDHVGLAEWLCKRWNAPLWMTAGEYGLARVSAARMTGTDVNTQVAHFVRHGIDAAQRDAVLERGDHYARLVPDLPASYIRLRDGMSVRIGGRDWRVIVGYGHSPEHAALYCAQANVLISGDMLLPKISTNVSVWALEPHADALGDFLASIERFRALPADVLVLPSHGLPFRGARTRVDQLVAHHDARLNEVFAACEAPRSAAQIVPLLFKRPLDAHQTTFALGEALAHLHRLWFEGRLTRIDGDDGVLRFKQAA
ncbi:MAG TPA: MBL fold metallo-hydrolase [Burkholderiaceae bacterium]|nr:MBL fold metallo-hydrolase [Burkholderiaceae bacterium]